MRTRADQLLVDRGLAESRSRAQALILAGKVFSGERRIAKAGDTLSPDAALEVRGRDHPWVSRGGLKLDHALRHFGLSPAGRICLDIGASTGGFTDVLLAHGAAKVHAVDVGHGQLAWKLRNDPRVVVHERTNARYLTRDIIADPIAALVCDASFIGLATVLPAALALCAPGAWAVALIKPQFEAGPDAVGSKGVVRDPAVHTGGVRANPCLVGGAAGLARPGHYRKPNHRTGRQPRVPDRRGKDLSVRPGSARRGGSPCRCCAISASRDHTFAGSIGTSGSFSRRSSSSSFRAYSDSVISLSPAALDKRNNPRNMALLRRGYGYRKVTNRLPPAKPITPTI